jgi:hypothetical protein
MNREPPEKLGCKRDRDMTGVRPRSRELAERSSNGTHVRLLWRQGTRQLWVEVQESDDRVLAIPVHPEQALEVFHHPYAFAGSRTFRPQVESLAAGERRPQAAEQRCHEL